MHVFNPFPPQNPGPFLNYLILTMIYLPVVSKPHRSPIKGKSCGVLSDGFQLKLDNHLSMLWNYPIPLSLLLAQPFHGISTGINQLISRNSSFITRISRVGFLCLFCKSLWFLKRHLVLIIARRQTLVKNPLREQAVSLVSLYIITNAIRKVTGG